MWFIDEVLSMLYLKAGIVLVKGTVFAPYSDGNFEITINHYDLFINMTFQRHELLTTTINSKCETTKVPMLILSSTVMDAVDTIKAFIEREDFRISNNNNTDL